MKNIIKKIILAVIAILFLSFVLINNPLRNGLYDLLTEKTVASRILPKRKEHYINVFVHGSFGSLLGFLSLKNVVNDDVDGTKYKNLTKKMRDDSFFYDTQPILKKGLVKIEPTFDIKKAKSKKFIAYPIINAYKTISKKIIPQHKVNYFYTYGWSGLLSLNSRRQESIRFFNELSAEVDKYHKQGIYPKIRILTHSHGGNMILNIAAINKILTSNWLTTKNNTKFSDDLNENESIIKIIEEIKKLAPTAEEVKNKKDQENWDYVPQKAPLVIDELISYGVPIQPETEPFYFDETFKKTYFFYSKEDHVQKADWVTSKRLYSDQRFNDMPNKNKDNRITQARIMIGREIKDNMIQKIEFDIDTEKENTNNNQNFLQKIFSSKRMFKKNLDPTHKELWFACWQQDTKKKKDLFGQFPIAILTPVFIKAMEHLNLNDVDINIDSEKNNYVISIVKHNEEKIQNQLNFAMDEVKEMIPKFSLWEPNQDSKEKEFSIISSYMN